MNTKNTVWSVVALVVLSLSFTSCSTKGKSETESETTMTDALEGTRFTATLNGASEKPTSTTSTATGEFVGVMDPATKMLSYTVTYEGLSPVAGHIHRITSDDGTGPPDIMFTDLKSPITGTTPALPQSKIDSMAAGQYYVNLHTEAYPKGEIRGDVSKQ